VINLIGALLSRGLFAGIPPQPFVLARPELDTVPLTWEIVGTGDFNGDGRADLVWRNQETGAVVLWLLDGGTILARPELDTMPLTWEIVGTGDFNGDGRAELVWRNQETGTVVLWLLDNWDAALGDAGPQLADIVIAQNTPGCASFESPKALSQRATELRNSMIQAVGLDLKRDVLSSQLQRTHEMDGYTIEVVRLEVFEGIYLPINVYIPNNVDLHKAPLVISPEGSGSATWSDDVQYLAANLALLGMVTVVTEGFSSNGARAVLPDNNLHMGYARELMGLSSTTAFYLQELVSTITWAVRTYSVIDPARIGAAGYSYGGGMAMLLAQVDTRVQSISVPATLIGGSCEDFKLPSDIFIESLGPDAVWSPPLEMPINPINSGIVMLYPRGLQTTSGELDTGAPASIIGEVMKYADQLYALEGMEDQLLYRTDSGDHNYGPERRQDTYEWLAHTLLGEPLIPREEQAVPLLSSEQLEVDISGTKTLTEGLTQTVDGQLEQRFGGGTPSGNVQVRDAKAMSELFPTFTAEALTDELVWEKDMAGIHVKAHRLSGPHDFFPVFQFQNNQVSNGKGLLYLPGQGTYQDIQIILQLLKDYQIIVSIDYIGIGELKSDRLALHTFARYFMQGPHTLSQMNVNLLRSFLLHSNSAGFNMALQGSKPIDIYGNGWGASLYTVFLKELEPETVGCAYLTGVPTSELDYLKLGQRMPDLLLWEGLFSETSVAELAITQQVQDVIYLEAP
jgi:VCBS repeat protein/acetyl xylan esterase AXE1